jgi:hypothetical protein
LVAVALAAGCAAPRAGAPLCTVKQNGLAIYVADMGGGRVLETDSLRGLAGARDFWVPAEAPDLSAADKALFPVDEMNECKPAVFRGQSVLLVTAWPTGFAVVRVSDRAVLFVATAPRGVHSAEVLPGDALVVASSTGGDVVRVYSTTTPSTADYPLVGAHGVVWDKRRQCLWTLGTDVLNRYEYDFDKDKPSLTLARQYPLPASGGHDLYPRAGRDALFVTTSANVWTFSPDSAVFAPFAPLADVKSVKSIGEDRPDGRLLYTTWGDRLIFANPDLTSPRQGASIYKARWARLPEFTYGASGAHVFTKPAK